MNALEALQAILHARDKGEDPALILDENSPLMGAAREAVKPSQAGSCQASGEVERLKFELRQVMIDYGAAERANDPERIRETSSRGVALIDSLAPIAAPRAGRTLTDAARDVLAERERQVSVEGWTHEHDDEHGNGSMATAAACYALFDSPRPVNMLSDCGVRGLWAWTGWAEKWFKPKDTRHNLIRAGALILAEIERLDRAASSTTAGTQPSAGE